MVSSKPGDNESCRPFFMSEQLTFGFGLKSKDAAPRQSHRKRLVELGISGYQDIYQELLTNPPAWETRHWSQHPRRKRHWYRKAAYIAWDASPRSERQPATIEEFADVFGITRQTIYGWRVDSPEIDQLVARLRYVVLDKYLADVDWITIRQAIEPDSTISQRELFYRRHEAARQHLAESQGAQPARVESEAEIEAEIAWLEGELCA